ncbi:60S ribosomal protein L18a [Galdieria sulphuraria]|nr:60S ribosomal protein L18a [Galdieria sulphuraria]
MKAWLHQYSVVGRKIPTQEEPEPPIYRLKIFAPNVVNAKSRFWYFLRKLKRVKKSSGEILNISEIFEKKSTQVKNYGIWIRYKSRTNVQGYEWSSSCPLEFHLGT